MKNPLSNMSNIILNDCEIAVLHDLTKLKNCLIMETSLKKYGVDYEKLKKVYFTN